MLSLMRREGESIMVGDDISIRVLGVRFSCVRLDFTLPDDVLVSPPEIWDRMQSHRNDQALEVGEVFWIGDCIQIEVLPSQYTQTQARLGVTAPDEIAVHREEIWERIQVEKRDGGYDDYDEGIKPETKITIKKRKKLEEGSEALT